MKTKRLIKAQKGIVIPNPGFNGNGPMATSIIKMTPKQQTEMLEATPIVGTAKIVYDTTKKPTTKNLIKSAGSITSDMLTLAPIGYAPKIFKTIPRINKIMQAGKTGITSPALQEMIREGFPHEAIPVLETIVPIMKTGINNVK